MAQMTTTPQFPPHTLRTMTCQQQFFANSLIYMGKARNAIHFHIVMHLYDVAHAFVMQIAENPIGMRATSVM